MFLRLHNQVKFSELSSCCPRVIPLVLKFLNLAPSFVLLLPVIKGFSWLDPFHVAYDVTHQVRKLAFLQPLRVGGKGCDVLRHRSKAGARVAERQYLLDLLCVHALEARKLLLRIEVIAPEKARNFLRKPQ